jgi:O-antigen ligase
VSQASLFALVTDRHFTDNHTMSTPTSTTINSLDFKLQQLLTLSFHFLIFFTPLLWTSITSELFEFPKMIFVYFWTVIILALWAIRSIVARKFIFHRSVMDLPFLLFFISQLLSTFFSINPHTSLYGYYSRFHGGLFSTISYLVLYYAFVSNISRSHIKAFLTTLLTSGVLVSLYAFPEHFGHSPSCAIITGEFNASCWVQDVQNRVFGTLGQPNWLAAYLITIFFIPLSLLFQSLNKSNLKLTLKNLLLSLTSILFFLTLLFTKSRSGLLGLAVGCVVFSASLLFIPHTSVKKTLRTLGLIAITILAIFFLFGRNVVPKLNPYLPEFTPSKIQNPSSNIQVGTSLETGGTESGEIRRIVWTGALDVWRQYPIFGSGVETFAYSYYQVRPVEHNLVSEWDFLYNKAHNEFLNFLATTGLVGLVTYLTIIMVFLWFLVTHLRSQEEVSYLFAAFLSGYLALAVSNFFGFSTVPVAFLFFLFPALAMVMTQKKPEEATTTQPLNLPQYFQIGVVMVICLFFLLRIFSMLSADISYKQGKTYLLSSDLTPAITKLNTALNLFPSEPNYTESLGLATAQASIAFFQSGDATSAAEFIEQTQLISNLNIQQNPANLNYHKTRARIYIYLAQIDPEFLNLAIEALDIAQTIAPTDPKITFNLALLHQQQGNNDKAIELYLKAIDLKSNYIDARYNLAQLLTSLGKISEAQNQYQYILDNLTPNNPDIIKALESLATMSAVTK